MRRIRKHLLITICYSWQGIATIYESSRIIRKGLTIFLIWYWIHRFNMIPIFFFILYILGLLFYCIIRLLFFFCLRILLKLFHSWFLNYMIIFLRIFWIVFKIVFMVGWIITVLIVSKFCPCVLMKGFYST